MSGSQPPGPEYDRLDFNYKNALGIENHIKDDENRNVDQIMVVVYDEMMMVVAFQLQEYHTDVG